MRSRVAIIALALLATAGCARGEDAEEATRTAVREPPPPAGPLPPGVEPAALEEGRRLYFGACVMCHGERGEGTQLGPPLASGTWSRTGGSFPGIVEVVTDGAPAGEEYGVPMPPRGHGRMSDEEIRAVSAYAYSISRDRVAPEDDDEAGGEG